MNNRIKFLLLLFIAFIVIGVTEYTINRYSTPKSHQQCLSYLQKREHALWQRFAQFGITQPEFNNRCNDFKNNDAPASVRQSIKTALKKIIYSILEKMQINPREISMQPYQGNSAAGYAGGTLYIDERQFLQLPTLAQQFAVGHEMQHMKFQDDIGVPILQQWIEELSLTDPAMKSLFNDYERFTEERADIQTALINKEFAQGFMVYFQTMLQRKGNNAGITHPKSSDRIKLAQNIYQSYQTAV